MGGETIVFETPRKWYDIQPHEHRVDMEPMGEYGRRIPYEFMAQAITFGFHYEMEDIDTLEKLDVECSFFEGETRTGGHEIWHSHDHSQQKNYQFVGYEKALSDIEEFEADEERDECLEQFNEESGDWPCVRYDLRRKPRTKSGLQIKFIDAKLVRIESGSLHPTPRTSRGVGVTPWAYPRCSSVSGSEKYPSRAAAPRPSRGVRSQWS